MVCFPRLRQTKCKTRLGIVLNKLSLESHDLHDPVNIRTLRYRYVQIAQMSRTVPISQFWSTKLTSHYRLIKISFLFWLFSVSDPVFWLLRYMFSHSLYFHCFNLQAALQFRRRSVSVLLSIKVMFAPRCTNYTRGCVSVECVGHFV